jgi:MFS family permease
MRRTPLIFAIALVGVGWATGGGAAQILFTLFGEKVFNKGPAGIGIIWGFAGIGLLLGGLFANWYGRRAQFAAYKRTIVICYILHGGCYVLFSQMTGFGWALLFIAMSRAAVAISSVLNMSQLLRHVSDEYRGRVFSTMESMTWSAMMISMTLAGAASVSLPGSAAWNARAIGAVAGVLSSTTAIFWWWANATGRLPEPPRDGIDPTELEVHGEPNV